VSSKIPEYFSLFALEPQFAIDPDRLQRAYREVLSQVHPDRYVSAGAGERRAALQMASHANEAYEVLRSDVARAAYLCTQRGVVVEGAGAAALPLSFLEQQMQWRETLEDARATHDAPALQRLADEVAVCRTRLLVDIASQLDERADAPAAAASVRSLMFVEKLQSELARALAPREPAAGALAPTV